MMSILIKAQESAIYDAILAKKAVLIKKGIDTLWISSASFPGQGGLPRLVNTDGTPEKGASLDVFWIDKGIIYTQRFTEFIFWEKADSIGFSAPRKIRKSNFTKYIQLHIGEVEHETLLKPKYAFNKGEFEYDCDDCSYCFLSFYIKEKHFTKSLDSLDVEKYDDMNRKYKILKYRNLNYDTNQKTLLKRLIDWKP